MIRDVHLHGRLGKLFGRVHSLDVDSPREAFQALATVVPGFRAYVSKRKYVVSTGSGVVLGEEQLPMRLGAGKDIHVTPAGLVTGLETVLLVGTLLFAAASAVMVLTMPKVPQASAREEATRTSSYMFDGAVNNTEQGHPVALVYGKMRVGSTVVSGGITTTDVNEASVSANPTNPGGGAYGGYVGSTPGIRGSAAGDEWNVLEKGGKGGGAKSRAAQEDPNSLQSQATAKILDLIGEGEMGGLVDGLKSVYFDDTPLQNADGTYNFAGIAVEQRVGLPDQDFIPGFSQTENSTSVDTEVTIALGPVTRTISDPEVTVARVTIRLPQLFKQDTTNGDLKATSVAVKVSVQADGGGFTDVTTMTFNGKTNSGYQRSVDVRLPNGVSRQVRVTRLTADSEVASLSNETHWDLLTEVVEAKLSYPDSALVGLTVDARQFGSNIPTRSYEVYGLIVEVPTNYDPITRVYDGVWDGTFKRAWTDNPAWVFRDIIVNRRYGLGARVPASAIDKWGLYAIAQYNDELVPDGFGGMEPRYTINCVINNAAEAYDVIASVASNFRGFAYWGSGAVFAVQDSPEDPSVLVTPANVVGGDISYGRVTKLEKRRSVAVVWWNDPEDGYKLTPEIYEVPDLVRRFGRRAGEEVGAFGVTRRGHAHRLARWIMEDESQGSNTSARYEAGDDHGFVRPGQIATFSDPMYTTVRRGGRVKTATVNSVTLDAPFTFVSGQSYTLRVVLPDGTTRVRPVTNVAGTATVVTVSGTAYSTAPIPGAVWTIESNVAANRQFRIRAMTTDEAPYTVDSVLHDPTKYDRVELDRDLTTPPFMELPTGPLQLPSGLTIAEFLLQKGNASVPAIQVSWASPTDPRITFFQAQYRRPGGANWEPFADSFETSRTIEGAEPGDWSFRVRGLDSLGNRTPWVVVSEAPLTGQQAAIPNVTGLALAVSSDALTTMLVWTKPSDVRPLLAEVFFALTNDFGTAELLATLDVQEYIVSQPGWYWVRSRFMDAVAVSPPSIQIETGDFAQPDWENINGRPLTLEELDAAAQAQIDDLIATYGDTASASASAAAAAASASTATAQATAAGGYATLAETYKDEAAGSMTSAAASAVTAGDSASAASGSAAAASASESSAATSASLSASHSGQARLQVARSLPGTFAADGAYFSDAYQGSPESQTPLIAGPYWSFQTVSGIGRVLQADGAGADDVATIGVLQVQPNRKYRVQTRFRTLSGTRWTSVYLIGLDSSYNYVPVAGNNVGIAATTTWQNQEVSMNGNDLLAAGIAYVRGYGAWDVGASPGQFSTLLLEDITESSTAAAQAGIATSQAAAATASAAAASSSEVITATYKADVVKINGNNDFDLGKENWFADPSRTQPQTGRSDTDVVPTAFGTWTNVFRYNPGSGMEIHHGNFIPVDPNRKYRIRTRYGAYLTGASAGTTQFYIGFIGRDASGNIVDHGSYGSYRYAAVTGVPKADGETGVADVIVTGSGNDSWTKFPPGTAQIQLMAIMAYGGSPLSSYVDYIKFEDVTESENAVFQANIAASQAVIATAQAAAAQQSAILSASVAQGGSLVKNSGFDDFPGTSVGAVPTDWAWGGGPNTGYRVSDGSGGYAWRIPGVAGNESYAYQANISSQKVKQYDYLVIEEEIVLNSGSLLSSGLLCYILDVGGSVLESFYIANHLDKDATNTVVGAGTPGQPYLFTKLIRVTHGSAYGVQLYPMSHYSGFGSTASANDITWKKASVRPATQAEIAAGVALPALEATVTTQASVLAAHDTKLATYLQRVSAGSGTAEIELRALDSGGSSASSIGIKADRIRLGSITSPVLEIVGGAATFTGELNVGGSSGGRVNIFKNVIKIFADNGNIALKAGNLAL